MPDRTAAPTGRATWQRRTEKVSEVIAREIINDIVQRQLPPGTFLPSEVEMLEQYDVGRASLREALRILEVHGLITIKPGRGGGPIVADASDRHFARMATMFFQLSGATYRDLMAARMIIEPMMTRVVAQRNDEVVRDALNQALDSTEAALSLEDSAQYVSSTTEFHSVILSVSGNPILDIFGEALKHIFAERVSGALFPRDRRDAIAAQHREIADAITTGNADLAEDLMRQHMIEYEQQHAVRHPGLLDEVVSWR